MAAAIRAPRRCESERIRGIDTFIAVVRGYLLQQRRAAPYRGYKGCLERSKSAGSKAICQTARKCNMLMARRGIARGTVLEYMVRLDSISARISLSRKRGYRN